MSSEKLVRPEESLRVEKRKKYALFNPSGAFIVLDSKTGKINRHFYVD